MLPKTVGSNPIWLVAVPGGILHLSVLKLQLVITVSCDTHSSSIAVEGGLIFTHLFFLLMKVSFVLRHLLKLFLLLSFGILLVLCPKSFDLNLFNGMIHWKNKTVPYCMFCVFDKNLCAIWMRKVYICVTNYYITCTNYYLAIWWILDTICFLPKNLTNS